LIERSFQGLSIAVETVRIVEALVEIWPNEVCDKYNQEIKTYLSIYCIAHFYSWVDHLSFLEFAHNSQQYLDQQTILFELMYGTTPKPVLIVTTISNCKGTPHT